MAKYYAKNSKGLYLWCNHPGWIKASYIPTIMRGDEGKRIIERAIEDNNFQGYEVFEADVERDNAELEELLFD